MLDATKLLELALERMGIAMDQLKSLDTECKKALIGFMLQAVKSGDANRYIKQRLAWLKERDEAPVEPPVVRATSRPVDPVPDRSSSTMGPRPRTTKR